MTLFVIFLMLFLNVWGAKFVVVKGMASINNNQTDLARYLAIENAKILALETARGVVINQKTTMDNSTLVFSKTRSQVSGRIIRYSILKEWVNSNNYWVEIGALVSDEDEMVDFSITLVSSDTKLENFALDIFKEEGFTIMKEPKKLFPRLTLNSTITNHENYEFYGKKAVYLKVFLSAELKDIDNSTYRLVESGEASGFSYNMALEMSICDALKKLSKEVREILDAPKKLYLKIENITKNADETEKILNFLNTLSSTVRIEHFNSEDSLICILEVSEDPIIFLSRIVKAFGRKIDLTWNNGVYEIEISGGV